MLGVYRRLTERLSLVCPCNLSPAFRPGKSPGTFRLPPTLCTSCRPGRDRRVPGPSKGANRRGRRQSNRGGGHEPTGQGYALRAANDPQKRSEEHTSELQSRLHLVCRLLLEKKKK